jgi:hypothetical protein
VQADDLGYFPQGQFVVVVQAQNGPLEFRDSGNGSRQGPLQLAAFEQGGRPFSWIA